MSSKQNTTENAPDRLPVHEVDPSPVEINNMHDVFSDLACRYLIHTLERTDSSVCVGELSAEFSNWLADVDEAPDAPADGVGPGVRQRVHQLHAFGLVDYDYRTEAVRLADGVAISVTLPPHECSCDEASARASADGRDRRPEYECQ